MCHAFRGSSLALSLCGALLAAPGRCADSTDLDQFEDKCFQRAAERAMERAARAAKNDRGLWVKELEATFPGKVPNPTAEDEYGAWYELVVGRNLEWKRDDIAHPALKALYDKVVQRMELGPVPSIKRDEFMKYARKVLMRDQERQAENQPDQNEDADKAFRVLDKNLDGDLDREEFTAALRDDRVGTDVDGNGRISKTEYRAYFQRKVNVKVEALIAKEKARNGDTKPVAKTGTGLPDWFVTLDADKDKQISLFEWRDAGRPAALFHQMDLNGDGLLTKDEYLRYVKQQEIEAEQRRRETGRP